MGVFIKKMLHSATLDVLTSNFSPSAIRQEQVVNATRDLLKTTKLIEFYPNQQLLIDRFEALRKNYPSIYAHRTFYVWQLGEALWQLTSLNLPDVNFLQSNALKLQVGVITILLDDICDMARDKAVFDKCVLALKGQIYNDDQTALYQLIADTSLELQQAIKQTPNYVLLKPVLEEAYQKWIASFEYSLSIGQEAPNFEEKWEKHLEIISHSTSFYLNGLIDLLFVSGLSAPQASSVAEVFLRTQEMVQLLDWVTTWERELPQRDFTSGVFMIALENNWVALSDLMAKDTIEKVRQQIRNSPVEDVLWKKWESLRVESHQIADEIELPAMKGYIDSFSAVMFIFVASAGLI